MTWFVELEPRFVEAADYALGRAAVKAAAEELEVPTPVLRWFIGPVSTSEGTKAAAAGDGFEASALTIGYHAPVPTQAVWVRAGLSREELVNTAAHETEHFRQDRVGDVGDEATRERKAARFGDRFAAGFLSRPAGIKSATLIVDDLLDADYRFTARASVPGLVPWTDLGKDLYPARPLIADGFAGLKGDRVGWIEDAEARNAELWMKAQIDKNARYRAFIGRLVEQGKLGFSADRLSAGYEFAGKSLRRWPFLLGSMRPVEGAW